MALFDQYSTNQYGIGLFFTQMGKVMQSVWTYLKLVYRVAQERHELERLDDERLKDIGLTRHQVDQETKRDIWDVPDR